MSSDAMLSEQITYAVTCKITFQHDDWVISGGGFTFSTMKPENTRSVLLVDFRVKTSFAMDFI